MDVEAFFDDGDEHVDGDGDPDLGFDSVLGSAKEALDAQVLFDPFEEQLHLPAITVEIGHGLRRYGEVVGQEVEGLSGRFVVLLDAA